MTLAQLRAKRAAALAAAKAITDKAKAESREITDAETETVKAHLSEADAVKADISKAEERAKLMADVDAAAGEIPAPRSAVGAAQPSARIVTVESRASEDPNRGFKSPRDFFSAVMRAGSSHGRDVDARLRPLATQGSDEQQGSQDPFGGFLVPQAFSPTLLTVSNEADPTIGRTTQIPMTAPIVNIPARTDKDHTTSVVGGLTFSRRSETGTASDSKMTTESISLKANPLTGLNFCTEELLSDSPISVAALIASAFEEQYAAQMLLEKLNGTGAGQYLGVNNAPCKVSVAKEAGQAANTIVADNVAKMRSRCWGYSKAIWIANHDTYPQLYKLSVAVGTGGSVIYQPSLIADRPDMLLGRPIFYSEFASTLGTVGDLVLGNWSQYLEGMLQGPSFQESIHVRFTANERTFRVTVRNDGQPWWKSALTPNKSTTTLSPFVVLATRA